MVTTPPVLLLIFNRPDLSVETVRRIVDSAPSHLFVAADGPRTKAEVLLTEQTRSAVLHEVPPEIPVTTLFRDENLGCKKAVEQAISWFFQHVSEGIILEDDCVPSLSFFRFCDDLLARYRDDESVMHISGYNHNPSGDDGYHYARLPAVWGWATWRSAWDRYQIVLPSIDLKLRGELRGAFDSWEETEFFINKFNEVSTGHLDTWDASWCFAILTNHGLAIRPNKNLVRNTGFGDERATHTKRRRSKVSLNPESQMAFPLHPPTFRVPSHSGDRLYFRRLVRGRFAWPRTVLRRLRPRHT